MIEVGVKTIICTCEKEMKQTGAVYGHGSYIASETYYCGDCEKYVQVITPNNNMQIEFTDRMKG